MFRPLILAALSAISIIGPANANILKQYQQQQNRKELKTAECMAGYNAAQYTDVREKNSTGRYWIDFDNRIRPVGFRNTPRGIDCWMYDWGILNEEQKGNKTYLYQIEGKLLVHYVRSWNGSVKRYVIGMSIF